MSRLDEQQRRWLAALESKNLGHGGDTLLSQITGLHVDTIRRGREELDARCVTGPPTTSVGRVLAVCLERKELQALAALKRPLEPFNGGEPTGGVVFVRRRIWQLRDELAELGHVMCLTIRGEELLAEGFRLLVNFKRFTGPAHPDRDTPFHYLQEWIIVFRAAGWPILSVETKKKGAERRLQERRGGLVPVGPRSQRL